MFSFEVPDRCSSTLPKATKQPVEKETITFHNSWYSYQSNDFDQRVRVTSLISSRGSNTTAVGSATTLLDIILTVIFAE